VDPIDLSKIKTYSIKDRESKESLEDAASIPSSDSVAGLLASLPDVLKARDFRELVQALLKARDAKRTIVWMVGAHVVKCGLTPVLADLAEKGFITHLATNGAAAIHDFELAYHGETSEDVTDTIKDGSFGMADETGRFLSETMKMAVEKDKGYGETLGRRIEDEDLPHKMGSLFWNLHRLGIPATVHLCVGTDIINQHPEFSGSAAGEASFTDFKILAASVAGLEGGVVMNFGSAVVLPETFLKALSVARNLGNKVENFAAANFDQLGHYRPVTNVLARPTGGGGWDFRGHHEIMIPLLAAALRAGGG
jgi:hypothetical protein